MGKQVCYLIIRAILTTFRVADASVLLVSPVAFDGTGLGTVNTVLTIQHSGSNTMESGCVAFDGSADVIGSSACAAGFSGGDEHTGASQTLTRTVAESGAANAADFRIVFNAVQPGGGSVTLDGLAVSFFSPSGTVLFTANTSSSTFFLATFTGTGKSGFVFALDSAQAANATAAGAFSSAANRIGLSATVSGAAGGPETFFVTSASGIGSPIPEPSTYLMLSAGLFGLGCLRFSSRHKS